MEFHRPVHVGDVVGVYAEVERVGRTSITVQIEAWVRRRRDMDTLIKVTQGVFTFVAIDDEGNKRPVPPA